MSRLKTIILVIMIIVTTILIIKFHNYLNQESTNNLYEKECQNVRFNINEYYQTKNYFEFSIENTGLKPIHFVKINLWNEKGKETIIQKLNIQPEENKKNQIQIESNDKNYIEMVQIIPKINNTYCENMKNTLSFIPLQNKEIINNENLINCSFEYDEESETYQEILKILKKNNYNLPKLPEKYYQIMPTFSVKCDNINSNNIQISIPSIYDNITIIKCKQGICKPIYKKEIENLGCHYQENLFNFSTINYSLKPIKEEIIEKNQFKFEDKNQTYIKIQTSENIKKSGLLDSKYLNFINLEDEWNHIISKLNETEEILQLKIDLRKIFKGARRVYLGIISTFCPGCIEPILKKVYEPAEKTDQAIILIHGLFGTSYIWDEFIEKIELNNESVQIWVYEYPTGISYKENAIILAEKIENIQDEFNTLRLVGKSMGGLVIRNNLYYAYVENIKNSNKYKYIRDIDSVIFIGTPNKGSPWATETLHIIKKIVDFTQINLFSFYQKSFYEMKDIDNVPTIPWINYYSISGTKSYEFAGISTTNLLFNKKPNDGVVSLDSTLYLGDKQLKKECVEYWTIPSTHLFIETTKDSKLILENILNENPLKRSLGHTNYYNIPIIDCSNKDTYFIIGQKNEPNIEKMLYCTCGDGICSGTEDSINCPEDCPFEINKIFGYIIILFLLTIIILIIRKKIKKYYKNENI